MRAVLSVAVALLLAACSESTGPGRDLRVRTSESVYGLIPVQPVTPTTVEFTVRNTGSEALALQQCGGSILTELQRSQAGVWVNVTSGFCATFSIEMPLVLAPGDEAHGETTVDAVGRYRIRVPVAGAAETTTTSYAVSPAFEARWLED